MCRTSRAERKRLNGAYELNSRLIDISYSTRTDCQEENRHDCLFTCRSGPRKYAWKQRTGVNPTFTDARIPVVAAPPQCASRIESTPRQSLRRGAPLAPALPTSRVDSFQ